MLATSVRAPIIVALCLTAATLNATRPRPRPVAAFAMPAPSSIELEAAALPSLQQVASQAPAPIGTSCPGNVAKIGIAASAVLPAASEPLRGASVDPESCLVAAWSESRLYVSWDGGESFAAFDIETPLRQLEPLGDRVVVVLDGEVGVLRRGDANIAWRSLAQFAEQGRAGAIVPVSISERFLAVSSSSGFSVSDDDGETWRTLAPPAASDRWDTGSLYLVDADGSIVSRQFASRAWQDAHPLPESDGAVDEEQYELAGYDRWLVTHVDDGTWHDLDATPSLRGDAPSQRTRSGWSYSFEQDRFWGCGGSEKLVASNGQRQLTLVGDQRPDVWEVRVISSERAAFVQYHLDEQQLAQLVEAELRPIAVPSSWWVQLIGVDRYDTPLALVDGHLLRWAKAGGWRILLSSTVADDGKPVH